MSATTANKRSLLARESQKCLLSRTLRTVNSPIYNSEANTKVCSRLMFSDNPKYFIPKKRSPNNSATVSAPIEIPTVTSAPTFHLSGSFDQDTVSVEREIVTKSTRNKSSTMSTADTTYKPVAKNASATNTETSNVFTTLLRVQVTILW